MVSPGIRKHRHLAQTQIAPTYLCSQEVAQGWAPAEASLGPPGPRAILESSVNTYLAGGLCFSRWVRSSPKVNILSKTCNSTCILVHCFMSSSLQPLGSRYECPILYMGKLMLYALLEMALLLAEPGKKPLSPLGLFPPSHGPLKQ